MNPARARWSGEPVGRDTCAFCGSREYAPVNIAGPRCLTGDFGLTTGRIENVACLRCGLSWNRAMLGERQYAEFYAGYEKKTTSQGEDDLLFQASGEPPVTLTADQVAFLGAHVEINGGGRILDVGCGKGAFLLAFLATSPGWTGFGIDPSASAAALARATGRIEVIEGMLESGGDFGVHFDAIAIMHVLEHLVDPAAAIDRLFDLLRPGGSLFVEVPNVLDPNMFYDLLLFEHAHHFNPDILSRMLRARGFEVGVVEPSTRYGALRIVAVRPDVARAPLPAYDAPPPDFGTWRRTWTRMTTAANETARLARTGRRVALFGAGMTAAALLAYTDLSDAPIIAFLDESRWKIGRTYFGHPIHSLDETDQLGIDLILVATMPASQDLVVSKLTDRFGASVDIQRLVDADGQHI
jgi:SAM-dependent methyltransferase